MGSGTKQNYWNNEDGCRITILKDGQKVYQMDWSNQQEAASVVMSDEQDGKLWEKRIKVAILCGVGGCLTSGAISVLSSYF